MKHVLLIACLNAVLALFRAGACVYGDSAVPQLSAGTAKVEITPSQESAVDLLGQRLSLRDPLYARVLVLKDENMSLAIVSVDLIVFASQKVITEAKSKWGVDHVILSATHTHAGPLYKLSPPC